MHASLELLNGAVLVKLLGQQGNVTRVILGGNDGILVTVDPSGKVHVTPPEGPGDPEVSNAIEAIAQSVAVLGNK